MFITDRSTCTSPSTSAPSRAPSAARFFRTFQRRLYLSHAFFDRLASVPARRALARNLSRQRLIVDVRRRSNHHLRVRRVAPHLAAAVTSGVSSGAPRATRRRLWCSASSSSHPMGKQLCVCEKVFHALHSSSGIQVSARRRERSDSWKS